LSHAKGGGETSLPPEGNAPIGELARGGKEHRPFRGRIEKKGEGAGVPTVESANFVKRGLWPITRGERGVEKTFEPNRRGGKP